MNLYTTSRQYAKAIFETLKNKELNNCLFFFKKLSKIIKNTKLLTIISNPKITNIQIMILLKIIIKSSLKKNKKIKNFLKILIKNKKLQLIPNILIHFKKYLQKKNKYIKAKIISSFILNKEQINIIILKLKKITKTNIVYKIKIKKSLIGGIYILIPNFFIDISIKKYLTNLQSILNN